MAKIIVTEFMSLDGVIEAPGGGEKFRHGGWSFTPMHSHIVWRRYAKV